MSESSKLEEELKIKHELYQNTLEEKKKMKEELEEFKREKAEKEEKTKCPMPGCDGMDNTNTSLKTHRVLAYCPKFADMKKKAINIRCANCEGKSDELKKRQIEIEQLKENLLKEQTENNFPEVD